MTIADIVKMREACVNGVAEICAYEHTILMACAKVEDGGGGLLERHATLEELLRAADALDRGIVDRETCKDCDAVSVCDDHMDAELEEWANFRAAVAALRASDALPTGKGET